MLGTSRCGIGVTPTASELVSYTFVILASGLAVLEYSLFPLVINLKNTNTGVKGLSQMCQARRRAEELAALPEVPSLPVPARRPS